MSAGRPPKVGLDFAGWEVGVLDNDGKVDRLIEAQGIAAFTVYFYLCMHAYATHGYYLDWSYSQCATTARKLGKGASAEFVKNVVDMCFECCLFDKGLFQECGVLTSRGIQRRYWSAIKDRASKYELKQFWLLKPEECQGFDLCTQNSNFPPGNSPNSTVQNSTVNDSTLCEISAANNAAVCIDYKEVMESFNRICTDLPTVRDLTDARRRAIRKAAERLENDGGFDAFFDRVHRSDFLCGRSSKWKCGFDWILKPANMTKIREGNYDNRAATGDVSEQNSAYEDMVESYIPRYKKGDGRG